MENKNYRLTLILATILGVFGVHRFINKKFGTGILMFLTGGGFLIWWIIDIYLIASNKFIDADGNKVGYEGKFFDMKFNVFFVVALTIFFLLSLLVPNTIETPTIETETPTIETETATTDKVDNTEKEQVIEEETTILDNRVEIQLVTNEIFTIDENNKGEYIVQKSGSADFNTSILTINGKSTMGYKVNLVPEDMVMLTNTMGDAGIKLVPLMVPSKDTKTKVSSSRVEMPLTPEEIITIDDSNKGSYIVQQTGSADFNTSILTINGSSKMGSSITLKTGDKVMLTNSSMDAGITLIPSN
ncbi:MAG: TM2 domain-containing protein [Mycoplasmatales bacterium]